MNKYDRLVSHLGFLDIHFQFYQDVSQASNIETQESIEEAQLEVSDDDDDDDDEKEETKPNEQPIENVPEEPVTPDLPVPAPEAAADAPSSDSSDEEEEEEEVSAYPDTQVTYSEALPVRVNESNPRKAASAGKPPAKPVQKSNNENQPLKRGQRARLKKIKEKYKDQDEEDRLVRMQLLGSAGNESKKKQQQQQKQAKAQNKENNANNRKKTQPPPSSSRPQSAATASASAIVDDDENEQQEDEEEKAKRLSEDARLLATLTGQPMPEDPLINVIGVCAPWVTLNNYKYKVKILPGGLGKKGKSKTIEN